MTDFDKETERRGTNSYKWDKCPSPDVLPLWVADMDFETAPCIVDALRRRVEHGVFGYVHVPEAYYQAVMDWFARRHGWSMRREWILYTTGVVPAISAIVQALTKPGDGVLVQTPVYNCFFSSIRNSGCRVVDSPLLRKGDTYVMDYDDLRRKTAAPGVKAMLLCNPHNPVGRVWTRDELRQVAEICLDNGVFVVCDEIHNELTMPGHRYTPYGTLGQEFLPTCAVCTSPSKAFNIAGLKVSNITAADPDIRRRIDKQININEICDLNSFGVEALMAAYTPEGEAWLNELVRYIHGNYLFLLDFFHKRLPRLTVTRLEGTYLVWVDCSALGKSSEELERGLLREAKVWFNAGSMYGLSDTPFLRINIACPRRTLAKALEAFATYARPTGA